MSYCIYCMAHLNDGETNCHRCGKAQNYIAPLHQLAPGTVLCDRYYIGLALGEGGFGITYIGRDLKLDMKVAIKEYFPSGFVNRSNTASPTVSCSVQGDRKEYFEQGRDRFLREARTLARFSGTDGIVDVRDFFEENNTAYIVMEYLDGETLKEKLVKNGVMTADTVITTLMPVFKALKKVHEKDLIHRDISPDNIMIVEDKIKLLDFGSARNVTAAANKSLSVLLKPGYAPEEQYRSKGVQGPWTDIYALCATIYKCITGRTPEDSTDRLFEDSLKMPSEYGIAIDRETEAVLMKGLAVRAADRYQNIDELLSALENRKTISLAAEEIKTEKIEETEEEKTVGVWGETVVSETPEMPETSEIAESEETVSIWSETVAPVTPEVPEIPCNTDESEETVCIWGDDNSVNETVNPEPEKVETPLVETEVEKTETAEKPEKGNLRKMLKIISGIIMPIVLATGNFMLSRRYMLSTVSNAEIVYWIVIVLFFGLICRLLKKTSLQADDEKRKKKKKKIIISSIVILILSIACNICGKYFWYYLQNYGMYSDCTTLPFVGSFLLSVILLYIISYDSKINEHFENKAHDKVKPLFYHCWNVRYLSNAIKYIPMLLCGICLICLAWNYEAALYILLPVYLFNISAVFVGGLFISMRKDIYIRRNGNGQEREIALFAIVAKIISSIVAIPYAMFCACFEIHHWGSSITKVFFTSAIFVYVIMFYFVAKKTFAKEKVNEIEKE